MSLADDILKAMLDNAWRPSRPQLKAMINAGRWDDVGKLFGFEPVYMKSVSGKLMIDWRCVPDSMAVILRDKRRGEPDVPSVVKRPYVHAGTRKHRKGTIPTQREHLYAVQDAFCHYCRKITEYSRWTVDHKIPRCRGGSSKPGNVVGACNTCNHAKANLTEEEFKSTDYLPGTIGRKGGTMLKEAVKRVSLAKEF